MRYTLVICDLGGVVVHFDSDRVIHQMAQLIGRSFDEVQRVVYHPDLLLSFELGRIRPEAYYQGLKEKLQIPWTYEQFVRIWNDIFSENQDVVWVVERLRGRHRLLALTNTNELHLAYLKAAVPSLSLFEAVIASCEVGLRKPDPQIYLLALQRAGVRPHEAVYIDDRPELVDAGRSVGLVGVRFENSQQLEHDLRQLGFNI
mgnify:CR=1 FL=1